MRTSLSDEDLRFFSHLGHVMALACRERRFAISTGSGSCADGSCPRFAPCLDDADAAREPLARVGPVAVRAGRRRRCSLALGVANIAMRARWHEVEDGVLWAARAEGVTALEVAPGSPAAARRHPARRRAARGQRLAGRDAGRRRRVPAPRRAPGTRLAYTLAAARDAPGARGRARAGAAAAARCTSCSRRSASSRCSSARRCGCGGRAIRRRCISSGCASRSSASSPSRSTGRSIGSTGSSTGATRSRWRCCRRCCCTSRWCFPSGRRARPPCRRARSCRSMYLPALALGAGARRRASRAAPADGAMFSRAHRPARSRRAAVPRSRAPSAALAVLVARVPARSRRVTGAAAAALDRLGHGARRRPVRARLRAAVGARRRSAARAAADGDSARPRAARPSRRRSCATACATSRSSSSAGSCTRRFSARASRSTSRCCKLAGFVVRERRRPAQLDRRAAGDARRRAAGAAGEGGRAERARPRVLPRSLRLPPRARRLRARSEQRPRRRAARASASSRASSRRSSSTGWR